MRRPGPSPTRSASQPQLSPMQATQAIACIPAPRTRRVRRLGPSPTPTASQQPPPHAMRAIPAIVFTPGPRTHPVRHLGPSRIHNASSQPHTSHRLRARASTPVPSTLQVRPPGRNRTPSASRLLRHRSCPPTPQIRACTRAPWARQAKGRGRSPTPSVCRLLVRLEWLERSLHITVQISTKLQQRCLNGLMTKPKPGVNQASWAVSGGLRKEHDTDMRHVSTRTHKAGIVTFCNGPSSCMLSWSHDRVVAILTLPVARSTGHFNGTPCCPSTRGCSPSATSWATHRCARPIQRQCTCRR